MTLAIKHNFVTAKADGTDSTLLKPSNWNEAHKTTLATATLVGRQSVGDGDAEEIPCSAAAAAMLAAKDIPGILAALGISPATTGDAVLTLKTVAPPGWVMMDDTHIGDPLSGSAHAGADKAALFTLIYNNVSDAGAPLFIAGGAAQTSRAAQGPAAQAFASHCLLLLPRQLGRAIVGAGTGPGLTGRALGSFFGEESHSLTAAELPSITSNVQVSVSGGISGETTQPVATGGNGLSANFGSGFSDIVVGVTGTFSGGGSGASQSNNTQGGPFGAAHNVTQASTGWNVMVKL